MNRFCFTLILSLCLAGCSPVFVIKAAYQESKILLGRKKIDKLIKNENTEPILKEKLQLVQNARNFTINMGLTPGKSFTMYSKVDKDVLVWVLAGAEPTAFKIHTWWFPFVGRVPYKGFFDLPDAKQAGKKLEKKGYEIFIRGSDALSTLGWFNDPVLSTTLKHKDDWIVNTVIHESLHTTIWFKNHVTFNESLANFVGFQGAVEFYKEENGKKLALAKQHLARELDISKIIEGLYQELDTLYKSTKSKEEKLSERTEIFTKQIDPIKKKYPTLRIFKTINNSEIMQLKFYLTNLDQFQKLYEKSNNNWPTFFKEIKAIKTELKDSKEEDPFNLLRKHIE